MAARGNGGAVIKEAPTGVQGLFVKNFTSSVEGLIMRGLWGIVRPHRESRKVLSEVSPACTRFPSIRSDLEPRNPQPRAGSSGLSGAGRFQWGESWRRTSFHGFIRTDGRVVRCERCLPWCWLEPTGASAWMGGVALGAFANVSTRVAPEALMMFRARRISWAQLLETP